MLLSLPPSLSNFPSCPWAVHWRPELLSNGQSLFWHKGALCSFASQCEFVWATLDESNQKELGIQRMVTVDTELWRSKTCFALWWRGGYYVHLLVWSEHFLGENFIFPAAQILPEIFSIKLYRMEVPGPLQRLILICPGAEDRHLCNPALCFYPTSSWPDPSQQAAVVPVLMLLMLPVWHMMLYQSENLDRKCDESGNSFFILRCSRHLLWLEEFPEVGTTYLFVEAVPACCKDLKIQRIKRWERRESITIPLLAHIRQKLSLVSNLRIILGNFST